MDKLNKISTQDLEALVAEESKCTDDRRYNKPPKKEYKTVINFIKDFNIQQGELKIPTWLIYYMYQRTYTRYKTHQKVGKVAFFHTFAQHFTKYRSNGKNFYLINTFGDVAPNVVENAKHYERRLNRESKRKVKVPGA